MLEYTLLLGLLLQHARACCGRGCFSVYIRPCAAELYGLFSQSAAPAGDKGIHNTRRVDIPGLYTGGIHGGNKEMTKLAAAAGALLTAQKWTSLFCTAC